MIKSVIGVLTVCIGLFTARSEVPPARDWNAHSGVAASVLQEWYNDQGLWTTTGWWNAALCVEAIQNVIVAQNGGPYLEVLESTFRRNRENHFINEYYDDEGWWALAWIRAYDLTGEPPYLEMAKRIFTDMAGGWDSHCDGGIWWRKDCKYKNAIANELFLLVAIKLHQRTPNDAGPGSFLDWAMREWQWFRHSGMINGEQLVNDGLTWRCENNGQTTWTYNQGVILGGLVELYKVTGDTEYLEQAEKIADATLKTLTYPNGVLRELCEPDNCGGADVPQFKGIFVRYLTDLHDVTRKAAYRDFLSANAHSIWANNRDSSNRFGFRWSGPIDRVDAARHSSAIMPISALAEPTTKNLRFAKGSGNDAFDHEVGAANGTLSWFCSAENAPRSGWMQTGPYLTSLPVGQHTVQFRLAVNATSASTAALVRLDVKDSTSNTVLAARDVTWDQFHSADVSQSFKLTFTNANPGNALEFRAYWNHAPAAPELTLFDVAISESDVWTAANLQHDVGQLDGWNSWCADPVRNRNSGFLVKGAVTETFARKEKQQALFELKVDNFNLDRAAVATLSVIEIDSGKTVASREVRRNDFQTVLFHTFALKFTAAKGKRYEARTFWHHRENAPRLTQRAVIFEKRN